MTIPAEELRIDAYPPVSTGGQQVSLTRTGVKVTHEPTGFAVVVQSERSRLKNKDKAILYLEMILELEGCLNQQGH